MYLEYYGLEMKPFDLLPDPRFLYISKGHDVALSHLEYGILDNKGLIALTGDVGTGKTTLLNYLLQKVEGEVDWAFVLNPQLTPSDFMRVVLRHFGRPQTDSTAVDLYERLHQFLLRQHFSGRRSILVIDEAQTMPIDTLESARTLSNLETQESHLIQIILAGQPQLRTRLQDPELAQLAQRISVSYHLSPLDMEETLRYIDHRLEVAGYERATPLFDDGALEAVFEGSRGIPRLINLICDTALMYGYADDLASVDAGVVERVLKDRNIGWGAHPSSDAPGGRGSVTNVEFLSDVSKLRARILELEEDNRELRLKLQRSFEEYGRLAALYKERKRKGDALMGHYSKLWKRHEDLKGAVEELKGALRSGKRAGGEASSWDGRADSRMDEGRDD